MAAADWFTWQLADSAFPTGSFAHSWGLEAAWQAGEVPDGRTLRRFLRDVLVQAGRGALPFVTAAHRAPERLGELDGMADAFLTNPVANRASRVQGRAFLSTCVRVWPSPGLEALHHSSANFHGHCAPVAGAALQVLDVPLDVAQRLFLYNTARGVLAAAVRLGIVGSYDGQRLQTDAGPVLDLVLARCRALDDRDVAQTGPILDAMQAAHDRLYSRLFQS